MITGKKISDSIISCKVIKTIPTTSQTKERNVSQYFVNKNIKIIPQTIVQSQQSAQIQQVNRQNLKQNQVSNNIQTAKNKTEVPKNPIMPQTLTKLNKNDKNIQKIKPLAIDKKQSIQKEKVNVNVNLNANVNSSIKQSKKPMIEQSKSQKTIIKQAKNRPNQNKFKSSTIIPQKQMNKKQISSKSQKEIKFEPPKAQVQQPKVQIKKTIFLNSKHDKLDCTFNGAQKQQTNQITKEKSIKNEQNNEDDQDFSMCSQQQQRTLPTPIQMNQNSVQIISRGGSQQLHNNSELKMQQNSKQPEVQNSFNEFLCNELLYSKIDKIEQNSFIKENDSICVLKNMSELNEDQSQIIQNQQVSQKQPQKKKIQKYMSLKPNQAQQASSDQIVQIDQNYMNFELSFEQTLLINSNDDGLSISSYLNLNQDNNQQTMLLQGKEDVIDQCRNIFQKDNFMVNQNIVTELTVRNIINSMSFSQTAQVNIANFKYCQSSDEDSDSDYDQQQNHSVSTNQVTLNKKRGQQLKSLKIQQKQCKTAIQTVEPLYQQKQSYNSSQQESQEENQAIQQYYRKRNMVTANNSSKIQSRKHQSLHLKFKLQVKQNSTILQLQCEDESTIIQNVNSMLKTANANNSSLVQYNLNVSELFSLDMEELIKKDFIMI